MSTVLDGAHKNAIIAEEQTGATLLLMIGTENKDLGETLNSFAHM